jgi:hypothetical protein
MLGERDERAILLGTEEVNGVWEGYKEGYRRVCYSKLGEGAILLNTDEVNRVQERYSSVC